nr:unnamed protein product [Callosobruchus chinensis]
MIAEREKVRVTFFQQSKPLEVDLPDEPVFPETDFMMASPVTMNETNHVIYNRTESCRCHTKQCQILQGFIRVLSK